MKRLLREPLLHFVVLGALLAGLSALLREAPSPPPSPSAAGGSYAFEVGPHHVASLREDWEAQWGRAPTAAELHELIAEHVREEMLVREARRLGLGADDAAVRRRLAERMELFQTEQAIVPEPTAADLAAFLAANRGEFAGPDRLQFHHVVFLDADRGAAAANDAAAALAMIRASAPPPERAPEIGDRFTLPGDYAAASRREIELTYGAEFAEALWGAPLARWMGPIRSPYGVHLVRVTGRAKGESPPLEAIRDQVRTVWLASKQAEHRRALMSQLVETYTVTYAAGVPSPAGR